MSEREAQLAAGLAAAQSRLAAAAAAAGRDGDDIELLPVTKFFPASDVAILCRLGCHAVGEARAQEASAKIHELAMRAPHTTGGVDWHMVGRIQRNKARSLADWAHTVHSVGSIRVAAALGRAAAAALNEGRRSQPLRVYVQASLDGDVSRGGADASVPGALDEICEQVEDSGALKLVGLMGIPPLGWDPASAFSLLAEAHGRVLETHPAATGLSAGMSGDLEAAVKHGSTCVRVGTALMGPRPLPSP
jgi:pyridoxal phosphate enzyme (YggS family)